MSGADDIGRWSERVAGRGDARDPAQDDADRLRDAIRAEDSRLAAEAAADRVGLERLTKRLEREGLLAPGPAVGRASAAVPRWLAIAASVAIVAIGARFLWPVAPDGPVTGRPAEPSPTLPDVPAERPRGFAGVLKQTVADPSAESVRVGQDLAALGFVPRRVDAAPRVILEIDVEPERLDAYRGFVEPRGGRAVAPGRYRIVFEPAP